MNANESQANSGDATESQPVEEPEEKEKETGPTVPKVKKEPPLQNPEPEFKIVDSSDEELESDELNLTNRMLSSIPLKVAKADGERIKNLKLTNNRLRDWKTLSYFTNLETLVLDKNELKNLAGVPAIPTLKTLWLNNNLFDRLDTLLSDIAKLFPKLEYLSLLNNPVAPAVYFESGNEAPYVRFRKQVIQHLPLLKQLDTTDVTKEERDEADISPQMLIARPKEISTITTMSNESMTNREARKPSYYDEKSEPAAFIGKGRIKYDGRDSEGNRFITNNDL